VKGSRPETPSSATHAQREKEIERLRRRVAEFAYSTADDGPAFLRAGPARHATFEHTLRCTACEMHSKARSAADGPAMDQEVGDLAEFGLKRQLLWDDWPIAWSCNVRREQGKPSRPGSIVLRADRQWEGYTFGFYGTVLKDTSMPGLPFKMWYRPFESGMALAVSDDGVAWRKPALNLVQNITVVHQWTNERVMQVPSESNVLPIGMELTLGEHLAVEPLDAPSHQGVRYIAAHSCLQQSEERWTDVCVAFSKDGLQWRPYRAGARVPPASAPPAAAQEAARRRRHNHVAESVVPRGLNAVAPGPADSYVQLTQLEDSLVMTTRRNFPLSEPNFKWRGVRGVRVLRHQGRLPASRVEGAIAAAAHEEMLRNATAWDLEVEYKLDMQYGVHEHLRRQIYSLTITKLHGIFIGLFAILDWPKDSPSDPDSDKVRLYFATSRDGLHFDLSFIYADQILLPPGTPGAWDHGSMLPASRLVTTETQHMLYYEASSRVHEERFAVGEFNKVGLAAWRLDGLAYLCSACPNEQVWAELTTRRFILRGTGVEVSLDVQEGGELRTCLLSEGGADLPGLACAEAIPITQSGSHMKAAWKSMAKLGSLFGSVIRLRFRFRSAHIYAFQVLP